ncbi:hypothetical protein I1A62_07000 [Rhodococcus sp. USK10]|nr:hypothetical protein I1A62_07000 [Rhodococcus sp. USK10]
MWVYNTFENAWSQGDENPPRVDALARYGRSHTKKYLKAFVFGDELAAFWGECSSMPDHQTEEDSGADAERRMKETEAGRDRSESRQAARLLRGSRQRRCSGLPHSDRGRDDGR